MSESEGGIGRNGKISIRISSQDDNGSDANIAALYDRRCIAGTRRTMLVPGRRSKLSSLILSRNIIGKYGQFFISSLTLSPHMVHEKEILFH